MNYLFRYLSTLKTEEAEQLERLDTTPRERDVFRLLCAMRAQPQWTKQDATRQLGMSGSMFDKTCSTLLRRVLDTIVPEGGARLLEHLAQRVVYDLLLHELRRQEKEALASRRRAEHLRFYRDAFAVLHMYFNSNYSERFARQLAAKLKRLDPSPDTAIYVEACLLRMAVWIEASRRTSDATRVRLEKRLRGNDARILESTGPNARYHQLKAWIVYYGQLKRNPEERMACLKAATELCERHPDIFPRDEYVRMLCQVAEEHYYYRTDHATPFRMYRELYERYGDDLKNENYHTYKYIQLALINGDLERAEQLLETYFGAGANMVVHKGGGSKDVALLWTKLSVLAGRYDDARRHLDDAVLLNQKGFYLQFEVECRMLHTALCFLAGDFDTVERRLPAHIKFLRSKGATYKTSRYYPWFFKLVGAFVDERTMGKKLPTKLEAKLNEFMEGAAAQYGIILKKLRGA